MALLFDAAAGTRQGRQPVGLWAALPIAIPMLAGERLHAFSRAAGELA